MSSALFAKMKGGAKPVAPAPSAPPAEAGAPPPVTPTVAPKANVGRPVPAKAAPRDIFAGVGGARMAVQANYLKAGHYLVRLDIAKQDVTRKGIPFVALEFTVVHVYDAEEPDRHGLGESVTHFLDSTNDYFLGEIKGFMVAALGCAETEVEAEMCHEVVADDQPLAGFFLEVDCRDRTSNKTGKPYTVIRYKRRVDQDELVRIMDPRAVEMFMAPAQAAPAA